MKASGRGSQVVSRFVNYSSAMQQQSSSSSTAAAASAPGSNSQHLLHEITHGFFSPRVVVVINALKLWRRSSLACELRVRCNFLQPFDCFLCSGRETTWV